VLQWRNKGINCTRPTVTGQHIGVLLGDLAHVEGNCWGGLKIQLNIQPVHRSRTGLQVQLSEGAVASEYQRDLDIVLTIDATGFGQQSVCGSQVASEKQLEADHPTLFKTNQKGCSSSRGLPRRKDTGVQSAHDLQALCKPGIRTL
jgi:hypothetical protein